jgi:hypothetical protein
MGGMKTSLIILIALALLACLVVLGSRPDEPVAASVSDTSRGPSFEVQIVRPRKARVGVSKRRREVEERE